MSRPHSSASFDWKQVILVSLTIFSRQNSASQVDSLYPLIAALDSALKVSSSITYSGFVAIFVMHSAFFDCLLCLAFSSILLHGIIRSLSVRTPPPPNFVLESLILDFGDEPFFGDFCFHKPITKTKTETLPRHLPCLLLWYAAVIIFSNMAAMIKLKSGQNVNLCTNEGASAFFAAVPRFVSLWTERATRILQSAPLKKGTVSNNKLIDNYHMLGAMAESLTTDQLTSLPTNEFECLVGFVTSRFGEISCTLLWRSTGALSKPDQALLDSIVPWLKHAPFVRLMLSSGGFQVLGELVARDENNKPTMPSQEVSETILMITNNAILTLKGKNSTVDFSNTRALMDLEETGVLAQALRCLTAPVTHGSVSHYLQMVDLMEANTVLLQNTFVPGTTTGNILEGILAGKDGWKHARRNHPNHMLVMTRLQALQKLAILARDSEDLEENNSNSMRICRHCGTTGLELKQQDEYRRLIPCSICKTAFYCDKACQQADSKWHNMTCQPNASRPVQPVQSLVMSFIQQNYEAIMTNIQQVCVENETEKKDVVLEIDFYKNNDHASNNATLDGTFRVAPISQVLEGDRPAEPDWFYRGSVLYESNVALFHEGLRDHHARMTHNHVLVAYRGAEGNAGVYRCDVMTGKTGWHICSDEALDLFPLDSLEKKMKLLMLQSGHVPVQGESEADLQRFMQVFGGGDLER